MVQARQLDRSPGAAIDALQRDLGLSLGDLAAALHVHQHTVERWRKGDTYPQRDADRCLTALMALHARLGAMFTSWEAAADWLHDPNRYLGDMTPAEVLRAGRLDRIDVALTGFEAGVFI